MFFQNMGELISKHASGRIPGGPSPSGRAADLLGDRPYEPWSVDRLASALGLSSRTLHRALRRELGVSPMRLLRRVRLAQARADLEGAGRETSVTGVAFDCGFNHLGRFAGEYTRRFGESPSETLRRARRRQAGSAPAFTERAGAAA
jgi:transcriptional regulator GlxA family with amidase domain